MITLSGYTLDEVLHEGAEKLVVKGLRLSDRAPIVAKFFKDQHPSRRDQARLRHEFSLLHALDIPGVVRAWALAECPNGPALILEAVDATPLNLILQSGPMDIGTALSIALATAEILASVHDQRVIHKDIKPHNLLVHRDLKHVHLIDFGIATRVSQEAEQPGGASALEGTLAYLSPEQTGRMNRIVDHRTDFYSLGVTLYEMLTGEVPFTDSDAMELIHAHIARAPKPPHERRTAIPMMLSALVMKLLAKIPEDRYQSARGLVADLQECVNQRQQRGDILPFALGTQDLSETLQLPQRLFGREAQIAVLVQSFERVKAGGTELVLVTGPAGIGKSALTNEARRVVVSQGCSFIAGKFDQLYRSQPFAGFTQAFKELCKALLLQPPMQLAQARSALTEALGANGRLLTDLLPELELVIGPQPSVPMLAPTEAQNRFGLAIQNFVRVFCKPGRPLVLYVDDLQWADQASLWLLRLLLMGQEQHGLLLIAAFRSEEVDAAHPLTATLNSLRGHGLQPVQVSVGPLGVPAIRQLLAEMLHRDPGSEIESLAAQIEAKTHGNPFFMQQFLLALQQERLLRVDMTAKRWVWDSAEIDAAAFTDNVVEFMAGMLGALDPRAQRSLAAAACIGYQFDLAGLAEIMGMSSAEAADALWPTLQRGLVIPLSSEHRLIHAHMQGARSSSGDFASDSAELHVSYRFLHDRVQAAAYALLSQEERRRAHLVYGRRSRASLTAQSRPQALFDVVHHLNLGAEGLDAPEERHDLVLLNLTAAQTAKSATAFAAAAGFLERAVAVLPKNAWTESYALAYKLHYERIECEYLAGRFPIAAQQIEQLLEHVTTDLERADLMRLRMVLFTSQAMFQDALMAGQAGLLLLGVDLPQTAQDCQLAFLGEVAQIDACTADGKASVLGELPFLKAPDQLLTSRLIADLSLAAYQVAPPLSAFLVARQVHLSLSLGYSATSAQGFVTYGLLLAGLLGRYHDAVAMGRLALQLVERMNSTESVCKVKVMYGIFAPYVEPMRASLEHFSQAQQAGLAAGDLVYASLAFAYHAHTRLRLGEPLDLVQEDIARGLSAMKKTQDGMSTAVLFLLRQVASCLQGRTEGPTSLNGDGFQEAEWLARGDAVNFTSGRCLYHTFKLELLYLFNECEEALSHAAGAERTVASSLGMHWTTDIPFYASLVLLALRAKGSAPPGHEEQLARLLGLLTALEQGSPANMRHRLLLVLAEQASTSADALTAQPLYEQAITASRESGFVQHEALANERAGRFYLAQGDTRRAQSHMMAACDAYTRWGAVSKAAQLTELYAVLLQEPLRKGDAPSREVLRAETVTTKWIPAAKLDVASVLRAAHAISSEIELDKVLTQVMRIVLASAGAQRGFLILSREGGLFIEAESTLAQEHGVLVSRSPLPERADLATGIVHLVARTREAVLLDDAANDSRFRSLPYIATARPRSILCLPLLHQGRLSGVLYLENNATTNAFSRERVELLQMLSSLAATSVENALLYANLQAASTQLQKANETLEQQVAQRTAQLRQALAELWSEMDLARKIQTVLLPTDARIPGYEMSALMRPAANVGGDYYDIVHAGDADWLLIGDVSGHGVSAGLCMMMVQTAIRAVIHTLKNSPQQLRPAEVLTLVNGAVHSNLSQIGQNQYMTITALCLRESTVRYAGLHQDILIYRAARSQVERVETEGVWIGVNAQIDGMLQEKQIEVDSEDIILLFTDGVTEARLGKRQFLCTEGLMLMFEAAVAQSSSPAAISQHIMEGLAPYTIRDDLTLIVLKRLQNEGTR